MMARRNKRFAICLSLALAAHAGLLAAVTRVHPQPSVTSDRVLTVTLSTAAATRPVASRVIAADAQRGAARRSQAPRTQHAAPRQQAEAGDRSATDFPEHLQQLALTGAHQPATGERARPPSQRASQQERPRLTRSARGDPRAAYLSLWRQRVETYGNRHYPAKIIAAAPRHRLTLGITLHSDGSVHSVRVLATSGSRALDRAARAMVRQAGPYAPLPKRLAGHDQRLTFAYDWVFVSAATR